MKRLAARRAPTSAKAKVDKKSRTTRKSFTSEVYTLRLAKVPHQFYLAREAHIYGQIALSSGWNQTFELRRPTLRLDHLVNSSTSDTIHWDLNFEEAEERGVMEEIFVPALGVSAENVYLQKWLKSAGDLVHAGEAIAIIETDKAELEITSNTSGTMGRQLFNEDTEIPVGATICVLLHEGETEN